jgi:hypothetical protein
MTIIAAAVVDSEGRQMARWKRVFRSIGVLTGLFAAGSWAATSSASAQEAGYRSAAGAPATWQAFAKQLQSRFEQRLAADNKDARAFQEYLAKPTGAGANPPALKVRAWIRQNGAIERLEFDGLGDDVPVDLHALLGRGDVGLPPPDMLQPLHLRLTLRPKEPAGGEK